MSDVPTAQQIDDLREDIGDTAETAFTDAQIQRIWYRVRGASSETKQHNASLGMMARQLLTNAAKLADYTAGDTEEKRSQIFKHLKDIYSLYAQDLEDATGTETRQFAMSALRGKPRQERTEPGDFSRRRGPGDYL